MPTYLWQANDGSEIEEWEPFKDAPALGARKRVKGKWYTRVLGGVIAAPKPERRFYDVTLPLNWKYAAHHVERDFTDSNGIHHPKGEPYFTSRKDIDETVARSKDSQMDRVSYER
jgi:hypothetical protein